MSDDAVFQMPQYKIPLKWMPIHLQAGDHPGPGPSVREFDRLSFDGEAAFECALPNLANTTMKYLESWINELRIRNT